MCDFRDLHMYKKAYEIAMLIFEISKTLLVQERYALIDQIRNCSRSVCSDNAEGYRKSLYQSHFLSKWTDPGIENSKMLQFAIVYPKKFGSYLSS